MDLRGVNMYKYVNGVKVPLTQADIDQIAKDRLKWEEELPQRRALDLEERRAAEYPKLVRLVKELALHLDGRPGVSTKLQAMIDKIKEVDTQITK